MIASLNCKTQVDSTACFCVDIAITICLVCRQPAHWSAPSTAEYFGLSIWNQYPKGVYCLHSVIRVVDHPRKPKIWLWNCWLEVRWVVKKDECQLYFVCLLEIGPKASKHLCHNFQWDTALDEARQQDAPLLDRRDLSAKSDPRIDWTWWTQSNDTIDTNINDTKSWCLTLMTQRVDVSMT